MQDNVIRLTSRKSAPLTPDRQDAAALLRWARSNGVPPGQVFGLQALPMPMQAFVVDALIDLGNRGGKAYLDPNTNSRSGRGFSSKVKTLSPRPKPPSDER